MHYSEDDIIVPTLDFSDFPRFNYPSEDVEIGQRDHLSVGDIAAALSSLAPFRDGIPKKVAKHPYSVAFNGKGQSDKGKLLFSWVGQDNSIYIKSCLSSEYKVS
jgi:hypothetical protein